MTKENKQQNKWGCVGIGTAPFAFTNQVPDACAPPQAGIASGADSNEAEDGIRADTDNAFPISYWLPSRAIMTGWGKKNGTLLSPSPKNAIFATVKGAARQCVPSTLPSLV